MERLVKRISGKLIRDEKGQLMVLVLLLMLVGGLIIGPLLGFMGTGLKVGQSKEQLMERFYAADAGVEDGLWKLLKGNASLPQNLGDNLTYGIAAVNAQDVEVVITLEQDVESFLEDLLGESAGPHDEWTVIEEVVGAGTYEITVTYNGTASNKRINGVGAWMSGTGWDYSENSSSNMTDDYPVFTFDTQLFRGGTAFIWEWTAVNRPSFGTSTGVYVRQLTFEFTPAEIPDLYFSWLIGGSMDIGVVPGSQTFDIWKVTTTATDNTTGKQTEAAAYVSTQGVAPPYPVMVMTWDISP